MPIKDDYEFGEVLGEGAYSKVYVGIDKKDGKRYAIKVLDKSKLREKDVISIQNEIAILKSLEHPNILRLRTHYDEGGKVFIVTELCEGGELFEKIVERECYSERDAQAVLRAIASAIQLLHSKNIVHRDLKPENILMLNKEEDSPIKVADFGFAKLIPDDGLKTSLGTPNYIAPEILMRKPYDEMVDIWAFGVICYVLLCGYPPFYADSNPELFEKIKKLDYKFDSPYWDNVSHEAKDLISKLLVLDPSARLTIDQVLAHPFMTSTIADNDITPVVSELRGFLERRRFKKAVRAVVAIGRLQSLLKKE